MSKDLYVVHCIDAEGPLHGSLAATFERPEQIVRRRLEPSGANLGRIQRCELDLGDMRHRCLGHLTAAACLQRLVGCHARRDPDQDYRERHADADGHGWVCSWFVVDDVGYSDDPRLGDIGYHNLFDHYRSLLRETGSARDARPSTSTR